LDAYVAAIGPSVPLWTVCAVLLAFVFKHFVADFLLQTSWIAHGKERVTGWFLPLAVHVCCHAALTLVIAFAVAPRLWWLALVDLAIHALIDRGKSVAGHVGKWKPNDGGFWWLMGFDQFLHHVTNIGLTAALFVL
jgi:hypothetical protein